MQLESHPLRCATRTDPLRYILNFKSPQQNLLKASAFAGGMITVRLLQDLIFGLILTNSAAATAEESVGKSPIVFVMMLVDRARRIRRLCLPYR
jgi:hypothetical protein